MGPEQEHVVVGVDGSPESFDALDWAASYAERFGLGLKVIVAWHVPTPYESAVRAADLETVAGDIAQQAVERAREAHPSLAIDQDVVGGSPGKALVAASDGAAILVVGTRRVLGSVSSFCSHYAPCSVMIVRKTEQTDTIELRDPS